MHELALAHEILALVKRHVPDERAHAVRTIRVRVGDLAGVVVPSLDFCFEAIVAGTPWQRASLAVEHVPARAACFGCGAVFTTTSPGAGCPSCGAPGVRMVSGGELHVDAVDLDDEAEAPVAETVPASAVAGEAGSS
ncbi:MAG: hydrogenase maturation nickel metallochaperone HypA [Vicinamibacterales bacterium]